MDSLIVLRRPLRKTQLEPKFIIPKKTKKALPKLCALPPTPSSSSNAPPISFVKLYKDVCMENARRATGVQVGYWPTRVRLNVYEELSSREHLHQQSRSHVELDQLEWPLDSLLAARRHVNTSASPSSSAASLLTTYCAPPAHRQLYTDLPPCRKARAELILELDYITSSKDSGF